MKKEAPEPKIEEFQTARTWRTWLTKHHTMEQGIWLRVFKKDSGLPTVTYAEALDEALCFGWIDGQKKSYDEQSWLQRFVPRRAKSGWSKINREHIERLTSAGKMHAAGVQAVEAAKADGRWEAAYDSPSTATPPDDFLKALKDNAAAKDFYGTLNKQNVYAILYRIQTAKKQETRAKRIGMLVEMLAKGETIHIFKPKASEKTATR